MNAIQIRVWTMANVPTILVDSHANVHADTLENDAILKWVFAVFFFSLVIQMVFYYSAMLAIVKQYMAREYEGAWMFLFCNHFIYI